MPGVVRTWARNIEPNLPAPISPTRTGSPASARAFSIRERFIASSWPPEPRSYPRRDVGRGGGIDGGCALGRTGRGGGGARKRAVGGAGTDCGGAGRGDEHVVQRGGGGAFARGRVV